MTLWTYTTLTDSALSQVLWCACSVCKAVDAWGNAGSVCRSLPQFLALAEFFGWPMALKRAT